MRALALLCLVAGCTVSRVVTVVQPYVAVLPIEAPDAVSYLGATRCDLQGHPYILVAPNVSEDSAQWILHHERVHILQIESNGGCVKFVRRYASDTVFRLVVEAEAFCGVFVAQRALHLSPSPDFDRIVDLLQHWYGAAYTREAVLDAMPCG